MLNSCDCGHLWLPEFGRKWLIVDHVLSLLLMQFEEKINTIICKAKNIPSNESTIIYITNPLFLFSFPFWDSGHNPQYYIYPLAIYFRRASNPSIMPLNWIHFYSFLFLPHLLWYSKISLSGLTPGSHSWCQYKTEGPQVLQIEFWKE